MARAATKAQPRGYELRLVFGGEVTDAGVFFPRVTEIISKVWKSSFSPASWYGYDVALRGVAQVWNQDADTTRKLIAGAGFTPDKVRDEASDRGTATHDFLDALAKGGITIESMEPLLLKNWYAGGPEGFEPIIELDPYNTAVAQFWYSLEPKVLAAERPLFSVQQGYGGRVDLIWQHAKKGSPVEITDLKTRTKAKQNKAYDPEKLQVCAYADAWEEMGFGPVGKLSILMALPTGKFVLEEVDRDKFGPAWRDTLSIYKRLYGGPVFV